jgi:hypothetical protein
MCCKPTKARTWTFWSASAARPCPKTTIDGPFFFSPQTVFVGAVSDREKHASKPHSLGERAEHTNGCIAHWVDFDKKCRSL